MVAPGWSLNHAKLRTMEDERDVLLVQERLLSDLKATMAPLERLAQEGRGTEGLIGELRCFFGASHVVNPSQVMEIIFIEFVASLRKPLRESLAN